MLAGIPPRHTDREGRRLHDTVTPSRRSAMQPPCADDARDAYRNRTQGAGEKGRALSRFEQAPHHQPAAIDGLFVGPSRLRRDHDDIAIRAIEPEDLAAWPKSTASALIWGTLQLPYTKRDARAKRLQALPPDVCSSAPDRQADRLGEPAPAERRRRATAPPWHGRARRLCRPGRRAPLLAALVEQADAG